MAGNIDSTFPCSGDGLTAAPLRSALISRWKRPGRLGDARQLPLDGALDVEFRQRGVQRLSHKGTGTGPRTRILREKSGIGPEPVPLWDSLSVPATAAGRAAGGCADFDPMCKRKTTRGPGRARTETSGARAVFVDLVGLASHCFSTPSHYYFSDRTVPPSRPSDGVTSPSSRCDLSRTHFETASQGWKGRDDAREESGPGDGGEQGDRLRDRSPTRQARLHGRPRRP